MLHAERGGATIAMVVTMVLVIGILGNGFFGAGMRAVQEREQNILRRFKVAPIIAAADPGRVADHRPAAVHPDVLLMLSAWRIRSTACRSRRSPVLAVRLLAIGAVAFRASA